MRSAAGRRAHVVTRSAACLLTGLMLIGCTQSSGPSAGATPTPTGAISSDAPTGPSDSATVTPLRDPGAGVEPGGGGTAGTGQIGQAAVSYPSGLTVSVTSAIQYLPSDDAIGTVAGNTGVVLTVRVENGSTQPLDTEYLTVALRTGAALTQAAQIFDAANDYGTGLTGTIAAGETTEAKYAFDVPASDLSVLNAVITPDLRSPRSAIFTGSATAAGATPQPQSS